MCISITSIIEENNTGNEDEQQIKDIGIESIVPEGNKFIVSEELLDIRDDDPETFAVEYRKMLRRSNQQ